MLQMTRLGKESRELRRENSSLENTIHQVVSTNDELESKVGVTTNHQTIKPVNPFISDINDVVFQV